MRRSQLIVTLSLLIGGAITGVVAQQRTTPGALTPEDYAQCWQLSEGLAAALSQGEQ